MGCFAIVFEAVPAAVSEAIMPSMEVPVIGIGAGAGTDGQVLVFHDLLGINTGHTARFVKRYARDPRGDGRRASAGTWPTSAGDASRRSRTPTRSIPRSCSAFADYLDQDTLAGKSKWDW